MTLKPGDVWVTEFTTASFNTGAATNATGTPTGTLVVDGVDNAATVTVTNITTGRYKASVTIPTTLSVGNTVEMVISATVASVSGTSVIARERIDTKTGADLSVEIGGIGSGTGAALNFAAASDNATGSIKGVTKVGTPTGTYTNTRAADGVYHSIENVANIIDWVYGFSVGGGRVASKVTLKGYLVSSNDTVNIQAYNYLTSSWETRGTLVGTNGTTNSTNDYTLLADHTGTGADAGKVYIRAITTGSPTSPTLRVDELLVTASNISQTVGYLDGAVWIDPTGTSGTTPFVNGTADNPVPTISDAYAIAAAIGLRGYKIAPAMTVTLTQSASGCRFSGGGSIAFGGQDISYAQFENIYEVSGIGAGREAFFRDCGIDGITIGHSYFERCYMKGTLTMVPNEEYIFSGCYEALPGSDTTQTIVWATGCDAVVRGWSGGLQFTHMTSGSTCFLDGSGRLVAAASCSGGEVTLRGNWPQVEGTGAANLTITQTQRWGTDQLSAISIAPQTIANSLNLAPASGSVAGSVNYQLTAIKAKTDLIGEVAHFGTVATGEDITIVRGNTHNFDIAYAEGIGTPSEVWLGIKRSALYDLDSDSQLMVSSIHDLMYIGGSVPASGIVSGATFSYELGVGFNFTCTAEVAALLTPGTYEYGIQWVSGGSVNEGITGTCTISADIIRET